jgi:uncharacterized protein
MRALAGVLLVLFALAAHAQKFAAIPPLTSHVTDTVGMLNANQRAALDNVLTDYEKRTSSQIAVLLVSSTEPEAIEQYGIRVAEAWKIGRKGIDNGAILIVAKDNPKALRRLRIEAGYGTEGSLTDAQAKRILQDVIAPHFRQNDFYGGLVAGVSAMTALLDKEHFAAPDKQKAKEEDFGFAGLIPFLVIGFFILVALSRSRRSRNSLNSNGWGHTGGIILGDMIGRGLGGGGGFGGGGGGFSGGGGGFGGGGASGDW